MRHSGKQATILAATAAAITTATVAAIGSSRAEDEPTNAASIVRVQGGTVSFKVDTNVPAVNIHGKSKALAGQVYVRDGSTGVLLEKLEASVPVGSIDTGMGLRDEHMRKRIFTTSDGRLPDLKFQADGARCSPKAARQSTCQLSGKLSLRDVDRPFTIALRVEEDGSKLRASGDALVMLSAYGIERPSNLGVQTADTVTLHLEFTATRTAAPEAGGRH
jgi:polyisoprenoid-binding protein YceI